MPLSARLFIISLLFFLFAVVPPPSFAQTNYVSQPTIADAQQESYKIQKILAGFGQVIICQLSGRDVFRPGYDCDGYKVDAPQGSNRQSSSGLLGMALGGIGSMYQPPINTAASLNYFAGNFGIIKPVLADESTGSFNAFSFLQNMYLAIRNVSYMLLVIVFIFIGMAIMLRFKIDPRTAMSIQNQLPKIVVGIVLITFSYAIAGLLADGMWVLTYFGINTIGNVAQIECPGGVNGESFAGVASKNLLNNPMAFTTEAFSKSDCFGSWDGISGLSKDIGSSMGKAISGTILEAIGLNAASDQACDIGFLGFGGNIGQCIQNGIYGFLTFLISIVAVIVVLVAIILALFRLWMTLIKAYVYILLDVVTAPIQIMMGIMPGGKMGFTKWLRHISAYLLIFPASATLIILAIAFALNKDLNNHSADPTSTFYPPLIGIPGISGNMGALIAFGLIMITPELLEMLKDALQVKNSDRATKAITGGFGRGIAPTAALGGFGKELFGKDKNGAPRIGNVLVGGLGNKLGISGENAKGNKWRGAAFRLTKRTQEKQAARKEKFNKQDVVYQRQRALHDGDVAYELHLRQPGQERDIAGATTARQAAVDNYMNKNSYGHFSKTTGATGSSPMSSSAPSPLKQASWNGGNELKDVASGTLLAKRTSPSEFTPEGSLIAQPLGNLTTWLSNKGYTVV